MGVVFVRVDGDVVGLVDVGERGGFVLGFEAGGLSETREPG